MKLTTILALCLGVASSALADAPKNFSYRVTVPAVAGVSCAQNANQIASAFAAANGKAVSNVSGACAGQQSIENNAVDIVVVSYQGEQVTPYRATISGEQYGSDAFSEAFATYTACASAIKGQVSFFVAETGLPAVAAYCLGSGNDMVKGYTLNIDGFGGDPQKRLYSFMSDSPQTIDYATIIPTAANLIALGGGQIAYQDTLRVYYYAENVVSVGVDNFSFYSATECKDQQGVAQQIAEKSGQTSVSTMCVAGAVGDDILVAVGLGSSLNYTDDAGTRSPDYLSYSECVQDRPRLTANYGDAVLGALCQPSTSAEGHYQLVIFTKMY